MIHKSDRELRTINKTIRFNEKELQEVIDLMDALELKSISSAVRYAVHEQLKEVQK